MSNSINRHTIGSTLLLKVTNLVFCFSLVCLLFKFWSRLINMSAWLNQEYIMQPREPVGLSLKQNSTVFCWHSDSARAFNGQVDFHLTLAVKLKVAVRIHVHNYWTVYFHTSRLILTLMLGWHLFWCPFHPVLMQWHVKEPKSICQKCSWQVTPKHVYTLDPRKSEWADYTVPGHSIRAY